MAAQQQQQIVADQAEIEATAAQVKVSVDTVAPDPQDDTVESVKVESDTTTSTIDMTKTFNEVVVITCHGCKETDEDPVKITNLNISLLETARTGMPAAASTITRFGPPNIPSVLKRIDQYVNQHHPGTPTTLKDVYDIVVKHTGGTHHTTEAFFAQGSEFVFLTPTLDAKDKGYFEIYEAQLFGTGCRLRHSGIFTLDQEGEVKDITFKLDLTPKPKMRYIHQTKNCNDNINDASKTKIQELIKKIEDEMIRINTQRKLLIDRKKTTPMTSISHKNALALDKSIERLNRLWIRYRADIEFLQYKLNLDGYIESGSHEKNVTNVLADESEYKVKLSDILNHDYFNNSKNYLVILHVCKVSCAYSTTEPVVKRTSSYGRNLIRAYFTANSGLSGLTPEPYVPTRAKNPYGGGKLNKRKSGSKKKKARTRAVNRKKRNRTKKRRTRNKNNNTNKRRKNK